MGARTPRELLPLEFDRYPSKGSSRPWGIETPRVAQPGAGFYSLDSTAQYRRTKTAQNGHKNL